ncbi:MAG: hypothetical protein NUW24_10570 [Anaerolineae bacterium]|jgi:hypothetical protein|nr:hypothetical protein [Anaerolineae bacterium]MDH7472860.1 hypothetical protein [Anaerolineae bacterium]
MGLDIWFREDILRALSAAEQASATTVAALELALTGSDGESGGQGMADPRYLRAYREGYRAALITMATAFGLTQAEDFSAGLDTGKGRLFAVGQHRMIKRQASTSAV